MRAEVLSAANFITNMMRKPNNVNQINRLQLERFHYSLQESLCVHYQAHWFPSNPNKGSGYRCIRINHKMDPIISQVGTECGFPEEVLRQRLPNELTMWVDPREVSYRIGENGSICVLYDGTCDNRSNRISPVSSEDEDTNSCSPMSISPPTIGFDPRMNSCKSEFGFNSDYILENRNVNFVEYVSS